MNMNRPSPRLAILRAQLDALTWAQIRDRMRQAADRIEAQVDGDPEMPVVAFEGNDAAVHCNVDYPVPQRYGVDVFEPLIRERDALAAIARWKNLSDEMQEECAKLGAMLSERDKTISELADAPHQWLAIVNATIAAMPPGFWAMAQAVGEDHECGNPLPVAVAAMAARIEALDNELTQERFAHMGQAALESVIETQRLRIIDLAGENRLQRERIEAMRVEWGAEVAAMAGRVTGLEADLREEQDRRQAMRTEWSAEVAAMTAQARHAEDVADAAKARVADLEALYLPALAPVAHVTGNTGHGHVYPRPDGVRMRCSGPPFCAVCLKDAAHKLGVSQQDQSKDSP